MGPCIGIPVWLLSLSAGCIVESWWSRYVSLFSQVVKFLVPPVCDVVSQPFSLDVLFWLPRLQSYQQVSSCLLSAVVYKCLVVI